MEAGFALEGKRPVFVAAHPDDEVIGAGGCFSLLRDPGFIHVTDGSPRDLRDAAANGFPTRESYADARRQEFLAALRLAKFDPSHALALGYVDQEASLHLAQIARSLRGVLAAWRPEIVLTHPYEGGHPDHDAAAFAVHAACQMMAQSGEPAPPILEFTSYHIRDGAMETGEFLPFDGCRPLAVGLSELARARKQQLLDCYQTQRDMLRNFRVDVECFRTAPRYDFTQPPHSGKLFYEQFPWGMTGDRWRLLARAALRDLGLS